MLVKIYASFFFKTESIRKSSNIETETLFPLSIMKRVSYEAINANKTEHFTVNSTIRKDQTATPGTPCRPYSLR